MDQITAENLTWARTGSLKSRPHVAIIEPYQTQALCGVSIARGGTSEIQPRVFATICPKCARELRKLNIDPQNIGLENDLA